MRKFLVFIILISSLRSGYSQETITFKYFGLTVHPLGDESAYLQPFKLDKKARFVVNKGLFIGYEKYVYKDIFSLKLIQGFITDCSNGGSSVSHFGIRTALFRGDKHRIYFGIGPTFIVRESWIRFGSMYQSSGFFNESESKHFGDIQWKLIPYGFEFEYDYCFTPKDQLSVSCTPGLPMAMIFSVGWKHWFHVKDYGDYRLFDLKKDR